MNSANNKKEQQTMVKYHSPTSYICGAVLMGLIIIVRASLTNIPLEQWSGMSWFYMSLPLMLHYIVGIILELIIFILHEINTRKRCY